jgi:hypothetical protein
MYFSRGGITSVSGFARKQGDGSFASKVKSSFTGWRVKLPAPGIIKSKVKYQVEQAVIEENGLMPIKGAKKRKFVCYSTYL